MSQNRDINESPCLGCTHRTVGCHAKGKCRNPDETYHEWRVRYEEYLIHTHQKLDENKEHELYLIAQHAKAERKKKNRH